VGAANAEGTTASAAAEAEAEWRNSRRVQLFFFDMVGVAFLFLL
jgi:hypothetical protein